MSSTNPRRVLLCTDFSDRSAAAVPYATALARHHDAELVVLHVAVPYQTVLPPEASSEAGELGNAALEKDSRSRLEALPLGTIDGLTVRREFIWAPTAAAGIVSFAEENAVDRVVLSSHGRRHLANVLLGSVARGVVAAAPCPVLCVKPAGHGGLDPKSQQIQVKRVLVPTDLSDASTRGIQFGADLAKEYGAEVHLLHVVHVDLWPACFSFGVTTVFDYLGGDMRHRLRERLRQLAETIKSDLVTVPAIVEGSPSKEIARYADENDIDVVVMSRKGSGDTPHLLGAVPERLLHDANCPVLVV